MQKELLFSSTVIKQSNARHQLGLVHQLHFSREIEIFLFINLLTFRVLQIGSVSKLVYFRRSGRIRFLSEGQTPGSIDKANGKIPVVHRKNTFQQRKWRRFGSDHFWPSGSCTSFIGSDLYQIIFFKIFKPESTNLSSEFKFLRNWRYPDPVFRLSRFGEKCRILNTIIY